ncbi:MAG: hypothetical protein KatS3mg129_0759 [Leptospiraceae bacterium]|nr:MAG: hypothetical protein KatS3mg129_0759 [Leptospiraceae bacterium]
MNHPSRKKIIISWLLETFYLFLQLISLPLYIPLPKFIKGKRGTIVIITDLVTSPLLYLLLRYYFVKEGYNLYFFYCYNPFIDLKQHSKKLSQFLLKIPTNKLTIIGHGAGGLLPLALPDEARKKIQRLITLDTPFWGTQVYNYLKFIKSFNDILPRSEYLLSYKMNALLYEEFYPFIAWQDEWIFPENLLKFGQGRDIILDIPGRLNLILHPENVQTLVQFFNQFFTVKLPLPEPHQIANTQLINPPIEKEQTNTILNNKTKKKKSKKTKSRKK